MLRKIDLFNMDDEDQKLLAELIKQNETANNKLLIPNKTYQVNDTDLQISDFIAARRTTHAGKNSMRYEVYQTDRVLGAGSYGKVYSVRGLIYLKRNKAILKRPTAEEKNNPHERVVKIITVKRGRFEKDDAYQAKVNKMRSEVEKEYAFAKRTPHLRAKGMIDYIDEQGNFCFAIFNERFKQQQLTKVLEQDEDGIKELTTYTRIALAESLLIALDEQIHEAGIIHRDLKPDNIMVDLRDIYYPEVNIFDLNLSTDVVTEEQLGTPGYYAPEAHANPPQIDFASDRFAMGICLAQLFNAKLPAAELEYDRGYQFDEIFSKSEDLSENDKASILGYLKRLYSENPTERPSLKEGIRLFQSIKEQRPEFDPRRVRKFSKSEDLSSSVDSEYSNDTVFADNQHTLWKSAASSSEGDSPKVQSRARSKRDA